MQLIYENLCTGETYPTLRDELKRNIQIVIDRRKNRGLVVFLFLSLSLSILSLYIYTYIVLRLVYIHIHTYSKRLLRWRCIGVQSLCTYIHTYRHAHMHIYIHACIIH